VLHLSRTGETRLQKDARLRGCGRCSSYDEAVFVGYRYFDEHDVEPLFPFGHGLSYTSFEYGEPSLSDDGDEITVELSVRNTGTRRGKDVVQVYVNKASESAPTPVREPGRVRVEMKR
jgi:beta-glucosidase